LRNGLSKTESALACHLGASSAEEQARILLDRRRFVSAFLLLALPRGAGAQQTTGKIPVLGVLNSGPLNPRSLEGARQGLRELGYVEGQTIVLEINGSSISR
jgi:hypothetical protein